MPWVVPLGAQAWTETLRQTRAEKTWRVVRTAAEGVEIACEVAGGGPLVVAGSLYLVGDVLRMVRAEEESVGEERRLEMTPREREVHRKAWWEGYKKEAKVVALREREEAKEKEEKEEGGEMK